jgi:hypothetical protein
MTASIEPFLRAASWVLVIIFPELVFFEGLEKALIASTIPIDLLEKLSCLLVGKHGVEVEPGFRKDAVKVHRLRFHRYLVPFLRLYLSHPEPRDQGNHPAVISSVKKCPVLSVDHLDNISIG